MIRWILLCAVSVHLFAETIEEKRAACLKKHEETADQGTAFLKDLNGELERLRADLKQAYREAERAYSLGGDVKDWLDEVNHLRLDVAALEDHWRRLNVEEAERGEEGYGLWDQEESTLGQLVMEYGAPDYLYVIPPEVMNQKISLHSMVPIPRPSWSELLEVILAQNGVGVKQMGPMVRQLYQFKQDLMATCDILAERKRLDHFPDHKRVLFVFSPKSEDIKSVFYFFERFRDPKRTYVHQVGNKVAIVSTVDEVKKLLALYDAVWEEGQERIMKVVSLSKLSPQEMEKVLKAYFGASTDMGRMTVAKGGAHLTILPLSQEGSLALVGMKDTVERAESLIKEMEAQIQDPQEMTVFWYTCRHSDPVDLSDVLEKVYSTLVHSSVEGAVEQAKKCAVKPDVEVNVTPPSFGIPTAPAPVNPKPIEPGRLSSQVQKSKSLNFIPYTKTGSIMMVVRRDTLPKLKELLKKLDVPKKMVQIDVLIFERKLNSENNFGLNILKIGSAASQKHKAGLSYEDFSGAKNPGILDFFLSRKASSLLPAFDLAYSFLLSQEDIRVNAAPQITTINQTPAKISIVEEISINNGAAPIDSNGVTVFEKSFTRNQFGIVLVITPTVHEPELEDGKRYVTLETNITFDNPQESSREDQPNIDRSNIENQVRVLDGETLILGGIRRKTAEDTNEKLPFLGEIPGVAKLFGTSRMTDKMRELFVFITPHVIVDPSEDAKRLREESLKKRAGDIPEFLQRLQEAQDRQKRDKLANSFDVIFGLKK